MPSRSTLHAPACTCLKTRPPGLTSWLPTTTFRWASRASAKVGRRGPAHAAGRVLHHQQPRPRSRSRTFTASGALPINYPNLLDMQRGKTGSGIWLHGTPPSQFSRAPQASDGCVVLANPDLEQHHPHGGDPHHTGGDCATSCSGCSRTAPAPTASLSKTSLHAWRNAKSQGQSEPAPDLYTADFNSNGKDTGPMDARLKAELYKVQGPRHAAQGRVHACAGQDSARHHGGDLWRGGRRRQNRAAPSASTGRAKAVSGKFFMKEHCDDPFISNISDASARLLVGGSAMVFGACTAPGAGQQPQGRSSPTTPGRHRGGAVPRQGAQNGARTFCSTSRTSTTTAPFFTA